MSLPRPCVHPATHPGGARSKPRMHHRQLLRETLLQPADQLGCEADLRNQQQALPAGFQFARDQPQIDFRLAAAGNSLEQPGAITRG